VTPVNNTTGVINPRSTTTIVSLTSGTNPSIFGDSLTFAASVAGSGSGAGNPTGGSVQFKVDGSNFGSPVALSAGSASFSTSSLNAGNHTISGVFTSGDANFNGSTSNNLSQDVNKANQTINFAALADMTFGDADFGVSAMASSGLAVSFSASGNCTVTGSTVHITSAGSCTITASQAGNANYNAATSVSQTLTINQAGTTTAIASTSNPSVVGELVTFTAAITQTQGGEVPTGTVTFKDGATTIGTGTLNGSAQASFTTSQLALGSHSITAVYGGDTNYSTSTSPHSCRLSARRVHRLRS
jgi:hypothetical protein